MNGGIVIILLYILLALLTIGFLAFIHELGHFLVAKAFKVPIIEFAIGMGPKIFSWVGKDNIRYSLRAFPIGGFVSMEGENGESDDKNAFSNIHPLKKILISVAGPIVNIIFAFLLMFILVITSKTLVSTTIGEFNDNATSNEVLQVYDKILKVGNVRVHSGRELSYEISMQGTKPIEITFERNGEKMTKTVSFNTITEQGVEFGDMDFKVYTLDSLENVKITDYLEHSFFMSCSSFKMVWDSLIGIIKGRFGVESVSGPVGMTKVIGEAVNISAWSFFYLVSLISMNLGVFNLLPIPALDGGHCIFHFIDLIAGKKVISKKIEDTINTVGIMVLFLFLIIISFKDVWSLIIK